MRIIEEEQLDFDDVLIQPKCSKILSRSEVNLMREFKWYDIDNTKKFTMSCIPYGTTNMGTVGVCRVAEKMAKSGHIACLEKHIPYEEIEALFSSLSEDEAARVIPSIGIKNTGQVGTSAEGSLADVLHIGRDDNADQARAVLKRT